MDDGHKWDPFLNSVPLLEAVLCADCEIISNSGGEACEVVREPDFPAQPGDAYLGGCIEGERSHAGGRRSRINCGVGSLMLVNPDAGRSSATPPQRMAADKLATWP